MDSTDRHHCVAWRLGFKWATRKTGWLWPRSEPYSYQNTAAISLSDVDCTGSGNGLNAQKKSAAFAKGTLCQMAEKCSLGELHASVGSGHRIFFLTYNTSMVSFDGGSARKADDVTALPSRHKMADMCYYGNVMTTTRWWLCVTILHLQQYSHRLNFLCFLVMSEELVRCINLQLVGPGDFWSRFSSSSAW